MYVNGSIFNSSLKICVIGTKCNVEGARCMGTVMGARNVSEKGLRQNERLHRLNLGVCLSSLSLSVVILFSLALD
jgi:hypothetical protein